MIFLITLRTEVVILCHTVKFSWLRRNFSTILTQRSLWLLLLVGVHHIVNHINRQNLIVLEHYVLMPEHLRILLLTIKINWLKPLRTCDRVIDKLILSITVRFPHRNLIHYTTNLLLCIPYPMKTHIEDHPSIRKFISFLTNLEQFVVIIQLLSGQEGLQYYTSLRVTTESWT